MIRPIWRKPVVLFACIFAGAAFAQSEAGLGPGDLPGAKTPGVLNPAVTLETINQTIVFLVRQKQFAIR